MDLAWSYDGNLLAVTDQNDRLFIWNTATWQREGNPIALQKPFAIDWRFDNLHLVSVSYESGAIQIVNIRTGNVRELIGTHRGGTVDASWDRFSGYIATVGRDGTLRLYDYSPERSCPQSECDFVRQAQNLQDPTASVFSPDGKLLAVSARDGVHVIDAQNNTHHLIDVYIVTEPNRQITSLAWSPDSRLIIGSDNQGWLYVWAVAPQPPERLTRVAQWNATTNNVAANALVWRPNGQAVAIVDLNRNLSIWDINDRQLISSHPVHATVPFTLHWNQARRMIATGSCDSAVYLWDVEDFSLPNVTLDGHRECITAVAFSPNGNILVTADMIGIMRVWDWQLNTHYQHSLNHRINGIAWSPDGTLLAAVTNSGRVEAFTVSNINARSTFYREPAGSFRIPLNALAWSPTGQHLATGSANNQIVVWDVANSAQYETGYSGGYILRGHENSIISLSWYRDPDRNWLASLSSDGVLRVWNALTGERLERRHLPNARQIRWSPAAPYLGIIFEDGRIEIWEFTDR